MGEAGEILLFHPFYVHLLLNSFKKLPKLTSKCKKQLYSIFFNVNLIFFDRNISWKIATFAKSSVELAIKIVEIRNTFFSEYMHEANVLCMNIE